MASDDRVLAFISYAREDAAIVNVLVSCFKHEGFRCILDSELPLGKDFHQAIRRSIQDCDAVIVALTDHSAGSAWVNQEIGFGLALGRPVCLIDLDPSGGTAKLAMASTLDISRFEDWSAPELNFRTFAKRIKKRSKERLNDELLASDLRQVIEGQIPRTTFITGRLAELLQGKARLEVFIQAAFSSLSISNHPMYSAKNDPVLVHLLQDERNLLERVIAERAVCLKMMVWPFRDFPHDPGYLPQSLQTLLKWMKQNSSNDKVRFVCGPIRGPNRMIFSASQPRIGFIIDGYKHEFTAGHNLTIVNYQGLAIDAAKLSFADAFAVLAAAQPSNRHAIEKLVTETRDRYPGLAIEPDFAANV